MFNGEKNMEFKAVIFDLDGVICSTDKYHYLAWKAIADEQGIYFDEKINNLLRGVSRMESLEIILKNAARPYGEEEKRELAERKNQYYRKLLHNMSPADLPENVYSTLLTLRRAGLLLAIGSSSKNTPFILGQLGLGGFFDAVADGNSITRSKPDPEVFLLAAKKLGAAPEDCLVVEDAVPGALTGHAAGMKVACVGDSAQNLAGDYNLERMEQLIPIAVPNAD
jgi:beta-phosphoglucomutase